MRVKNDKQINKMYDEINKKDLIYDTIDRSLLCDILDKMIEIADFHYENNYTDIMKNSKTRNIYENNLLCYRIRNNKIMNEPSSRDTVLSILSAVHKFVDCYENEPDKLFSDSIFSNTVGLCSNFKWKNKLVSQKMENYYKCLGIPDGQPFTSKYYFFNDGTLTDKINKFLSFEFNGKFSWFSPKNHL